MSSDLDTFDDANPYAPPRAAIGPLVDTGGEVWRDGDILVMTPNAALPARCVQCNAPANGEPRRRQFYWRPLLSRVSRTVGYGLLFLPVYLPAAWKGAVAKVPLAALLSDSPLIPAFIFLVLGRLGVEAAKVSVGLCALHERKQGYLFLGRFAVGLIGVALLVGSTFAPRHSDLSVLAYRAGWAVLIVVAIHAFYVARVLRPQRITKQYVRLRGACPAFLAALPAYPVTSS